jgi:hypothetical protein
MQVVTMIPFSRGKCKGKKFIGFKKLNALKAFARIRWRNKISRYYLLLYKIVITQRLLQFHQ